MIGLRVRYAYSNMDYGTGTIISEEPGEPIYVKVRWDKWPHGAVLELLISLRVVDEGE